MSDGWYIRKGPKTLGPLTEIEVRHVLEAGRISPETPVRRGADGPWIPAGQALSDATRAKVLGPSATKSRIPIAIAVFTGLAILVAGIWAAFGIGRRPAHPDVATAPPDDGIKPS